MKTTVDRDQKGLQQQSRLALAVGQALAQNSVGRRSRKVNFYFAGQIRLGAIITGCNDGKGWKEMGVLVVRGRPLADFVTFCRLTFAQQLPPAEWVVFSRGRRNSLLEESAECSRKPADRWR